jgi:peptidoglycan hydrolase CwlO-like protein
MSWVLSLLLIFFVFLIMYQCLINKRKEGLQNNSSLTNLEKELTDLSGNVANLQSQVNGLIQAQQQYASQVAPSGPPEISGAVDDS